MSAVPPRITPANITLALEAASRLSASRLVMSVIEPNGLSGDGRHGHTTNAIEQRILAIHERVPSFGKRTLTALPHAGARVLAVPRIEAVEHSHSFDDAPENREGLAVVARVVGEVDVDLVDARVGFG